MLRATRPIRAATPTHAAQEMAHSRAIPAVDFSGNRAALRQLSRTSPRLQRKLSIGAVNDPLEAEADRAADHVMRMPNPSLSVSSATPQINRKCSACEDEDKKLNAKSDGKQSLGGEAPPIVHDVLNSPGQPLDPAARTFMESRFGRSFDQVRIHPDQHAAASARAIGALAYTAGNHIAFGTGEYAPSSPAGQRLMAHELAHVLQQNEAPALRRACGPTAIGKPAGCEPGDPVFTPGATFRFVVNCDDWAARADADLIAFAPSIPSTSNIQIDGYASIEGPEAFNTNLACARALKAEALLIGAGIPASRITRIVDHGATPGNAADRRSVVIQPIGAPAQEQPNPPGQAQNQPQTNAPTQPQNQPQPTPNQTQPQNQPQTNQTTPPQNQTTGSTGDPQASAAAQKQDEHPRLVIQVPMTPINVQVPVAGPGGLGTTPPAGQPNTAWNQAYQPNIAAGLNYIFQPDDIGFQLGGFVQFGANFPFPGSTSPLTLSGHPSHFTGLNVQGYLQPAYVFFKKGPYQISVLVQPGVGRTFLSPVPGENGITYTVQGGFQITRDIVPNRWQFVGSILGGVNKTRLDDPAAGQPAWQDAQPFFGVSIGIQPIIPLLDYPNQ